MITLQQYDIELRHVKGTDNHLADIIIRNPAGLNVTEIRNLTKPNTIMVNKISLNTDKSVCKDLRNLAQLQKTDPRIQKIRARIATHPTTADHRYRLWDDTLFCMEVGNAAEWKPVLPACLEEKVIKYAHTSLGHLGVDKCTQQINQAYYLKNLGHKVRKYIACCDICQRVKYPNTQRLKSKSAYEKLYCIVLYSIALYCIKISKSCVSQILDITVTLQRQY